MRWANQAEGGSGSFGGICRMSVLPRLCCKTIFRIRARKIESRSRVNAQHRFKNSFAPIRLLRISIPQLLRGDFCNTIPPIATKERTSIYVGEGPHSGSRHATAFALRELWRVRTPLTDRPQLAGRTFTAPRRAAAKILPTALTSLAEFRKNVPIVRAPINDR